MAERQREADRHPSICYLPHINLQRRHQQAPPCMSPAMLPRPVSTEDYNLPGNTVIAPIKIDSGWGFGHWQSWADADNIATTTSNAGKVFTNLGIMQPSLYLNYVVKV